MFPIHKFACEGDGEGIRRCLQLGIDPDELDTDSWAPLHYACWYSVLHLTTQSMIIIMALSGTEKLKLCKCLWKMERPT